MIYCACGCGVPEWTIFDGVIGRCIICLTNCRSVDPAQVMRHPNCNEVRVTADVVIEPPRVETAEALTLTEAR